MTKKIIVANWKMNNAFDEADQWLASFADKKTLHKEALEKVQIVICPPLFLIDYLDTQLLNEAFDKFELKLSTENKKIEDFAEDELFDVMVEERPFLLGAQDCYFENSGSFTGDISAEMVKKIGADYVILGHSERRQYHLESDEIVAKKARAALLSELTPIICVGENKEVRDQQMHLEFVYQQLLASLSQDIKFKKLIIAYEPIWSIGTGIVPSAEQIFEMIKLIREILAEKGKDFAEEFFVLYGGSVTEENSQEILAIENVDGVLVGKASLDVEKFIKICVN